MRERLYNQTLPCLFSVSVHLEVKVNLTDVTMRCPYRDWLTNWQEQPDRAIAKQKADKPKFKAKFTNDCSMG